MEHVALYEDIFLGLMDMDIKDLEPYVRGCIRKYDISWTRCRATLHEILCQCALGIPDIEPDKTQRFERIIRTLAAPQTWSFLCQKRRSNSSRLLSLRSLDYLDEQVAWLSTSTRIPRPVGKERVFLHAFSGRRRPGDLQHYLEAAFARNSDGVLVHVVSMDLVIDSTWGDACNAETKAFWLRGAMLGYVQGGLCGPPCETWSQARFVQIEEAMERQPRPLRSL